MTYLKMLRQAHGLSQADLGKRLGYPRTKVSMFENGWYAKPPRGLEERLQAVFGKHWTFTRLMETVPTSEG